jgi:hypothetical protein
LRNLYFNLLLLPPKQPNKFIGVNKRKRTGILRSWLLDTRFNYNMGQVSYKIVDPFQ